MSLPLNQSRYAALMVIALLAGCIGGPVAPEAPTMDGSGKPQAWWIASCSLQPETPQAGQSFTLVLDIALVKSALAGRDFRLEMVPGAGMETIGSTSWNDTLEPGEHKQHPFQFKALKEGNSQVIALLAGCMGGPAAPGTGAGDGGKLQRWWIATCNVQPEVPKAGQSFTIVLDLGLKPGPSGTSFRLEMVPGAGMETIGSASWNATLQPGEHKQHTFQFKALKAGNWNVGIEGDGGEWQDICPVTIG